MGSPSWASIIATSYKKTKEQLISLKAAAVEQATKGEKQTENYRFWS